MADRSFLDQQGRRWEIRVRSKSEWELVPAGDNRERPRWVRPPGYEPDPFEMSVEELQRLLGQPDAMGRSKPGKNPFMD
jgi:hypothetical protein